MPTFLDVLVQRAIKPILDASSDPARPVVSIRSHTGQLVNYTYQQVCDWASRPPSAGGYEAWFIERGDPALIARFMAGLIVREGKRVAKECREAPKFKKAIRFLAEPGHQRASALRRMRYILDLNEKSTTPDSLFDEIGGDRDLIYYINLAVDGDEQARAKVTEIAAAICLRLPHSRGRQVSAASAAHEFFLECLDIAGKDMTGRKYTWDEYQGDFTDTLSRATRSEFGQCYFDPRPALRRRRRAADRHGSRAG